jgi:hypothetical protein
VRAALCAVERREALRAHAPPTLDRRSAPRARPRGRRWGGFSAECDPGRIRRRHGAQRPRYALQASYDGTDTDARQGEPPLRRIAVRDRYPLEGIECQGGGAKGREEDGRGTRHGQLMAAPVHGRAMILRSAVALSMLRCNARH